MIANPIMLWALAGLAVPIAIHLLSRKEGKVLKLGSLRHVQETSTQQFRGIRLNEVALLLLRSAMIVALTLLLAGLLFPTTTETKWLLVEKGLEGQPRIALLIDSLTAEGYEPRWLRRGFPSFHDSVQPPGEINYRELVQELDKRNNFASIVFASNIPRSFAGLQMPLGDNIRWVSYPAGDIDYSLQSIRITKDSVVRRVGHSSANATSFEYTASAESDAEEVSEPIVRIGIYADPKYESDKRIIKAALGALDGSLPMKIIAEENQAKAITTDWLIWLSDHAPPSGNTIRMHPDEQKSLLINSGPAEWYLTKRLTEQVAIESNLSVALAAIIFPNKTQLEVKAATRDRRMVPDSIAWSFGDKNARVAAKAGMSTTGEPFLIVVFLILLTAERILAYYRKQ